MRRGDVDSAVSAFEGARADLAAGERPMLGATIGLELGHVLADTGQMETAAEEGRAALACFARLGASAEVERAQTLLRRLGASETQSAS